ncbi:lysosomal alpha-mannosidase, partial [Diaphorina citri]|uniref:Alpha-mannosidase n=1 Tax=Diaphorina citri TaxID=121845 RepID=A0A3Q0J7L7_DIACI
LRSVRYVKSISKVVNMRVLCVVGIVLGISLVAFSYPFAEKLRAFTKEPVCGYELFAAKIFFFLIQHHDDVGWLKTVDQYYWGTKSNIQLAGVQFILDSVVRELIADPKKKFIYVETAFFWKWWTKQDDLVQKQVKLLVNEGRLEFIGGAWSMNDEAVAHYTSTIDQFSWGLRKLNDTFGKCARPRVGWQIDPFGHSREQASLFSQMGYDGFMFGRQDYQDKSHRLDTRQMEMIWQGSESIGTKGNIFTHALYNTYSAPSGFCFDILCGEAPLVDDEQSPEYNIHDKVRLFIPLRKRTKGNIFTHALYNTYSAPSGFCFDILCGEAPLVDDEQSPEYNIHDKIEEFIGYVKGQAQSYTTNNIIITMGGDFTYQDAAYYFKSLDKLIRYFSNSLVHRRLLHDDAFGVGEALNETENNLGLIVAKQLDTLTHTKADLAPIKEAVGIMQHHDAITGTEKQHVAYDYARIVFSAMNETNKATEDAIKKLLIKEDNGHADNIVFYSCLKLNMSECEISERAQKFVITLYNPLSHHVDFNVRVPVQGALKYTVQNGSGIEIPTQILPIHPAILNNPSRQYSTARVELVFKAARIPPFGLLSYFVTGTPTDVVYPPQPSDMDFIGSTKFGLKLNPNGSIRSVFTNGKESTFTQEFAYYIGASGDNRVFERRSSGAYIFRNNGSAIPVTVENSKLYNGALVSEIHQTFSVDWINAVIRVYKDTDYIDVQWIVGPIPIDDGNGKEVISRYTVDGLANRNVFYTDSNGREMLKRIKNYRPTWNYEVNEPVSGNYYPITSRISLKAESNLTVLVDRAEGGSSLQDGQIELMVRKDTIDGNGKEVISRYTVDGLANRNVFYTDSNGREMLKRIKNYRPTWNYEVNEPVSGNYYPITSRISLKAESNLTVLVDRAEGGSSLQDGQIELMVHRRLLHDDAFGVGEALNETENNLGLIVYGHHTVLVNRKSSHESLLQLEKFHAPWIFLSPANEFTWETWSHMVKTKYSGLTRSLPQNVHVLTLEAWKPGTVLLRLEHIMEKSNADDSSRPVQVDIQVRCNSLANSLAESVSH